MKKLSKLLALLLALAIVFSLTACSASEKEDDEKDDEGTTTVDEDDKGDKDEEEEDKKDKEDKDDEEEEEEEDITGEWLCQVDVGELLAEELAGDVEAPDSAMYLNVIFEFTDDEFTMKMELDEDSFKEYMDELLDIMIDVLVEENGMTEEELNEQAEAEYGKPMKEAFAEMMEEEMAGAFDDYAMEYYYKLDAKEGYIYVAEDKDELDDSEQYMEYTIKGDKLTIESFVDENGEADMEEFEEFGLELPWKFEKQ